MRKKDISEEIESKIDGTLEILYMNKKKNDTDRVVGNLKARLIRNSMIAREGLNLAADNLSKPSTLGNGKKISFNFFSENWKFHEPVLHEVLDFWEQREYKD